MHNKKLEPNNKINTIDIPKNPLGVINALNNSGFQAYIVGGCVRDSIIGHTPKDWDITTNAKPEEIKKFFSKTIDTGLKHGTVTVMADKEPIEVTTYRIDGKYLDGRRPESVEFTSSLKDDLSRRDFTMNAIAYHPSEGFYDPFSGITDINNGIIRTVGQPNERFTEDALRMLRAIRFSAQLNFSIDACTFKAISTLGNSISLISQERIREELNKLLVSSHPEKFILLKESEILQYILPEFEPCFNTKQNHPYHIYDVATHSIKALASVRNNLILRWTLLLHDIGKPSTKTTDEKNIDHFYGHSEKSVELAEKALRRLKFDNKSISLICRLIKHHDRQIEPSCKSIRKALSAVGDDIFEDLLEVMEADKKAQSPEFSSDSLQKIAAVRKEYLVIKSENQCFDIRGLNIDGTDLIKAGFREGKHIGDILDKLLEAVINDPSLNNKEKLLEIAKSFKL